MCQQDTIGRRLRGLRESMRPIPKMKLVSELCGLGSSTLRRYERNESDPKAHAIVALAKFYGVSSDYILGLTEKR